MFGWPLSVTERCSYLVAVHRCFGILLEVAVNFALKIYILCPSDTQSILACDLSKLFIIPNKIKILIICTDQ